MQSSGSGQRAIGYLTVCQDDRRRFWGGLLLIDRVGRPMEFHSTVPVTASRAHTILYGPTLAAHVYGELIAPALLQKVKVRPLAVITDYPEVLSVRRHSQYPLVCVCDRRCPPADESVGVIEPSIGWGKPGTGTVPGGNAGNVSACPGFGATAATVGFRGDGSCQPGGAWKGDGQLQERGWLEDTPVRGVRSRVLAGYESDAEVLAQIWPSFGGHVDLMEPLVRIREALSEAQQAA